MSLYRKYRPQAFADVVGQDHVVTTLEQAAKQDKLAHAYLFAGSRGTGKTSVARIMAKVIMTRGIEDEKIRDQVVKGIEEGSIVDLLEIDAASNRGIDDIRDLVEKIQFSPVVAAAKVYIIDEVHMLTKEAFNALLKTLEEPPAYAYFILATTELNKIPSTIQSRCQCFPFRFIRDEDIVRRLQYISDQERITVDREALRAIARHVEGGMRDAVSLLDQLRSLEKIEVDDVKQRIGSTGHEFVEQVLAALDAKDTQALVQTVRTIEENGIPLDVFARQLLSEMRDKVHEAVQNGTSTAPLVHILDVLLDAIRDIRSAPVPGLVMEAALLHICSADASTAATAPLASAKPEPATTPEPEVQAAPAPEPKKEEVPKEEVAKNKEEPSEPEESLQAAAVEAADVTVESVRQAWPKILKDTQPASIRMSLKDGHITGVEGSTVKIAFSSAFHRDKVQDTEASRAIEDVMEKIFKKQLKIECDIDANAGTAKNPDENMVNLADAASEIF